MFDTHLDMTWVTDGGVSDVVLATIERARQAAAEAEALAEREARST